MLADIIFAIADELGEAAPTHVGMRELARNSAPPRYVWVPISISSHEVPMNRGRNPKILGDDSHQVEVHCWGADLEEATRLRQALIAVTRKIVGAANTQVGNSTYEEKHDDADLGYVVITELTLRLPLPEVELPVTRPIRDFTRETAKITSVAFDPSGAVDGDGILEAGES